MNKRKCFITHCEECNAFNLFYKGVQIHVSFKSLQFILSGIYQYDNLDERIKSEKLFRIKIDPVFLAIDNNDYNWFKEEVENAVMQKLSIQRFNIYNYLNN